jgi:thiamine-monophosphate kinase
MLSEFDLIKRIRDQAPRQHSPDLVQGIGDDAAVLRECDGRETLITADLLVEDIDFKLKYVIPRWLGHKALAVSLSDIAAMGAAPVFSLLTLGIPKRSQISNLESEIFIEEFFAGYFALAEKHNVALIGGDISSSPDRLVIDSIVIGQCRAGGAVRRSGARSGDAIYLTGAIGASAVGLQFLLRGERVNEDEKSLLQKALRAHLRPEPRVEFGRQIGESGLAHSMIDVSDGLAQDLAHICEESGVTAILDFDAVPIADELSLVTEEPATAFEFAVGGGEDFGLLLTASSTDESTLFKIAAGCEIELRRIGEIISADHATTSPILVRRHGHLNPLLNRGFDHFPVI